MTTERKRQIKPVWRDSKPVPDGFWKDKQNRLGYMEWIEKQLKIKNPEDWFKVTKQSFRKHRGMGFLACGHGDSPIAAVREYNQELARHEWLFRSVPQGFWKSKYNRKRYLKWLAKELGIKKMEGWYQLTGAILNKHHGGRLLQGYYGTSVIALLNDSFPGYDWLEWKLAHTPKQFWKSKTNRLKYLTWLGKQLGFKRKEHWKKLTRKDFKANHGEWLLLAYYDNDVALAVKEF